MTNNEIKGVEGLIQAAASAVVQLASAHGVAGHTGLARAGVEDGSNIMACHLERAPVASRHAEHGCVQTATTFSGAVTH